MKRIILDTFNTPDSVEWHLKKHTVRVNGLTTCSGDRYLVWDQNDILAGEVPSLRAAKELIDERLRAQAAAGA